MTKAEAWLQCSARGTMVTRLAYIGDIHPSCSRGRTEKKQTHGRRRQRSIPHERRDPGTSVLTHLPLVTSSPTSSSHHCIIAQLEERLVLVITKIYQE